MKIGLDMLCNDKLPFKAIPLIAYNIISYKLLADNLRVHKSQKTYPKGFFGFFNSMLLIALLAYNIIAYKVVCHE
tara:strand:+ start:4381 stop:4605 length:225 start_codon:yes stop_codon:yes gene_type:complete